MTFDPRNGRWYSATSSHWIDNPYDPTMEDQGGGITLPPDVRFSQQPTGTAGFTGNPRADWMALVQGLPATRESVAQAFPQFAQWYPGSSFEKADIRGPWGWADVIGGLDDPSKPGRWQWYSGDNNPLTPPRGSGGFGMLSGGTGSLAGIAAAALQTSPGFQFRIAEGQKALERSAAARGTLLTGGTLKGINRYAQDYASNEYANQYARLFGEQQARYQQLYGLAGLGLQGAQAQAGLGTSYAGQAGNLYGQQAQTGTGLITSGANAGAAGQVGSANAYQQAVQQAANNAASLLFLYGLQNQGAPNPNAPYPGQRV